MSELEPKEEQGYPSVASLLNQLEAARLLNKAYEQQVTGYMTMIALLCMREPDKAIIISNFEMMIAPRRFTLVEERLTDLRQHTTIRLQLPESEEEEKEDALG